MWFSLSAPNSGDGFEFGEPYIFFFDRDLKTSPTKVGKNIFGFQLLAGVDYSLSERTSVGVALRWARFDDVDDVATWNLIRSHAPVQADGVTPFDASLEFAGLGYQAVTVNMKYRF